MHISDTSRKLTSFGLASCGASVLPAGSVLFSSRAPIGHVAINTVPMATNQGFKSFIPHANEVLPEFLYYWLRANRSYLESLGNGATFKEVSKAVVARVEIRLPPLLEQGRIAGILDKAEAIRRKRKEAMGLADELLRCTFLEMFGDPVANPMKWPIRSLAGAIGRLEAGWSANGEARVHGPGELGVLKVSAVTSGTFRPEEHKAVAASAVDRDLVTPRRGDLLFSRANTRELVAATCLVPADFPTLFLPDKLWRITPNPECATAEFIKFILSHERLRLELTKTATGTSGSMLNISMDKLRALKVPMPPLQCQERFASVVWGVERVKGRQRQSEENCEELFMALVAEAFRGARQVGSAC